METPRGLVLTAKNVDAPHRGLAVLCVVCGLPRRAWQTGWSVPSLQTTRVCPSPGPPPLWSLAPRMCRLSLSRKKGAALAGSRLSRPRVGAEETGRWRCVRARAVPLGLEHEQGWLEEGRGHLFWQVGSPQSSPACSRAGRTCNGAAWPPGGSRAPALPRGPSGSHRRPARGCVSGGRDACETSAATPRSTTSY